MSSSLGDLGVVLALVSLLCHRLQIPLGSFVFRVGLGSEALFFCVLLSPPSQLLAAPALPVPQTGSLYLCLSPIGGLLLFFYLG